MMYLQWVKQEDLELKIILSYISELSTAETLRLCFKKKKKKASRMACLASNTNALI